MSWAVRSIIGRLGSQLRDLKIGIRQLFLMAQITISEFKFSEARLCSRISINLAPPTQTHPKFTQSTVHQHSSSTHCLTKPCSFSFDPVLRCSGRIFAQEICPVTRSIFPASQQCLLKFFATRVAEHDVRSLKKGGLRGSASFGPRIR